MRAGAAACGIGAGAGVWTAAIWTDAGAGGAGADAAGSGDSAAALAAPSPPGAGKETTRASCVRSITGTVSRRRSKTTRETGFGAGLNCATRTRSTTELSTLNAVR